MKLFVSSLGNDRQLCIWHEEFNKSTDKKLFPSSKKNSTLPPVYYKLESVQEPFKRLLFTYFSAVVRAQSTFWYPCCFCIIVFNLHD